MNYIKAKTEAQKAANNSKIDYCLLFNGVDWTYAIEAKVKGDYAELIIPDIEYVVNTSGDEVATSKEVVEYKTKPKRKPNAV